MVSTCCIWLSAHTNQNKTGLEKWWFYRTFFLNSEGILTVSSSLQHILSCNKDFASVSVDVDSTADDVICKFKVCIKLIFAAFYQL